MVPKWSLHGPYVVPTWSLWSIHNPYVVPVWSLRGPYLFCLVPTWNYLILITVVSLVLLFIGNFTLSLLRQSGIGIVVIGYGTAGHG